jgi:hypothetical protein
MGRTLLVEAQRLDTGSCGVVFIVVSTHHDQMITAYSNNGVIPYIYIAHRPPHENCKVTARAQRSLAVWDERE